MVVTCKGPRMVLDSYNVKVAMILVAVVVTVGGYAAMQNRNQQGCDPCMLLTCYS